MTGHFKTIIWRRGYGTDQGEPESKGPVQIVDAVYRAQELSISGIAQELGLKAVNGYLKSSLAALVADLTKTEIVASQAVVPVPMDIRPLIYEIRGRQVMLDRDLAALYGVLTKNLNKAVKLNVECFPEDFMFQLTKEECLRFQSGTLEDGAIANMDTLRFQNGTSKNVRGVKVELVTHSNGELAESDFEAFAKQCGNFTKIICGIRDERLQERRSQMTMLAYHGTRTSSRTANPPRTLIAFSMTGRWRSWAKKW